MNKDYRSYKLSGLYSKNTNSLDSTLNTGNNYRSCRLSGLPFQDTSFLKVSLNLVTPVQFHGSILQVFSYKRIKVESLDASLIKRVYELQNAKAVTVLECPNFFLIQYPGKPFVFINKKDGKLYVLNEDGFEQEEKESQASFVVRMLHKFQLVEDLHSKKISRKHINIEQRTGKR